jgi:O-glycosyl hydrolase
MTINGRGFMPTRSLLAMVVLFNLCFAGGLYANLALNPGFELGSNSPWVESRLPDNWWKWQSGGWAAWKNNASSVGASGANYVNTGAYNYGEFVRWGQNINVVAGNYYTLSVDAVTENWGNPNGALLIEWKTSSDVRIGDIQRLELFNSTINTTWSRYSFTKQAPAGAAKAAFMLEGAARGTIMYDNVVVVTQNADFNNDNWVNFLDFAMLANKWRQTDSNLDLSGDNFVGMADLALFAGKWLNYYEPSDEGLSLTVNDSQSYQQIDGFGASLTDSSAYLLYYSLTAQQRLDILTELFDSDSGIGLNYLRQPMGTSDMRRRADYTYDDIPSSASNDYALTLFTIASDQAYIIPVLLEVTAINPQIKIMGSPWGPPTWMKVGRQFGYGSLIDDDRVYNALADYFVKYVQAYAGVGIDINSITVQNEPLLEPGSYPGMQMSAAEQIRLIKLLGPKFAAAGISTKIICYDHNWDNTTYPLAVLADSTARGYIAGTAFHGYSGDVSAQTTVHNAYPDKEMHYTEWSDGEWNDYGFAGNLIENSETIIDVIRNWSRTFIKWNLALDQNNGPKIAGGCDTCYGVITLNTSTGQITRNPQYYSMGQVSKFVQPGAYRIWSTVSVGSGIKNVAFLNPDGTRVCMAINTSTAAHNLKIVWNSQHFIYTLPASSVATFIWPNQTNAFVDVWVTTGDHTKLLAEQGDVQFHN